MKTILILDDEQVLRDAYVDYFEDYLWEPISAGSAEEALELLESISPAAAVVDVRLPGMDGSEFIRRVLKQNSSIAFVICTGSPEYIVPPDLLGFPCVSERLFKKPIANLAVVEEEIQRIVRQIEGMENEDD